MTHLLEVIFTKPLLGSIFRWIWGYNTQSSCLWNWWCVQECLEIWRKSKVVNLLCRR